MILHLQHVKLAVHALGGVRLGKASPPCFGAPPGISQVPSRGLPPPPPPPAVCQWQQFSSQSSDLSSAVVSPTHMAKVQEETHLKIQTAATGAGGPSNPSGGAHPGGGG